METEKMIRNIVEKILHVFLIYTIGVFLGCVFYTLKIFKVVRVLNKERIPHNHNGLIVISNHPSLLEPILIPLLFFWDYILHPFKLCPINIPDKTNYLDKWYWWWLRLYAIPINRKDKREGIGALFKMRKVLNAGGIIIPFTEGGRTCFGKAFAYSNNGKKIRISDEVDKTTEGARGISWLISQTNPTVLFIWVEGAEKVLPNSSDRKKLYQIPPNFREQVTIKIGKPVCFLKGYSKNKMAEELTSNLLNLANE
jgi:1-acyl-sn-glycerol-3-phosphate acyltransferase